MTTIQQLVRACQSALLRKLPDWHKYRSYGIYRRTDDFVQWILLQKSSYDVLVRPAFAIQALAEQFPAEALTLGSMARTQQGSNLWIGSEYLTGKQFSFVDAIVSQVQPSAVELFDATAIDNYLETKPNNHVDFLVAQGIVSVILERNDRGREYFKQALISYQNTTAPWADEAEQRINCWLACPDKELRSKLLDDARNGAELLGLKHSV